MLCRCRVETRKKECRVLLVTPSEESDCESGFGVKWMPLATHLCLKLQWAEETIRADSMTIEKALTSSMDNVSEKKKKYDAVFLLGLRASMDDDKMETLIKLVDGQSDASLATSTAAVFAFGCEDEKQFAQFARIGSTTTTSSGLKSRWELLPWNNRTTKTITEAQETAASLFARCDADDAMYAMLILIDKVGGNDGGVQLVRQTKRDPDFGSVICIADKCGEEVIACLTDEACRKAISELSECPDADQVCQYQAIVRNETPNFENFSRCVLQSHNCLGNSATIPTQPDPEPMRSWRGEALTNEAAERIFIGWLAEGEKYSWRVIAGKNPAYDAFPCQYQIFYYRGDAETKKKRSFWYDPVFKVMLNSGTTATSTSAADDDNAAPQSVWRRRNYRVRRDAADVGRFKFTVLDNGVLSDERWTIVDAGDALEFAVFYYRGAAAAAGQSYTGAVICSRDGSWPEEDDVTKSRIVDACRRCGIEPFELKFVCNDNCSGAPLDLESDAMLADS